MGYPPVHPLKYRSCVPHGFREVDILSFSLIKVSKGASLLELFIPGA